VAGITAPHFRGLSSLYKNETTGDYLLVLTQGDTPSNSFDRICNIISEYGSLQRMMPAGITFFAEHYEALIEQDALSSLSV